MDIGSIIKGYTAEQHGEALVFTLVNYLSNKGLINYSDFENFYKENFPEILQKIKDRDLAIAKETYEKYMNEKESK